MRLTIALAFLTTVTIFIQPLSCQEQEFDPFAILPSIFGPVKSTPTPTVTSDESSNELTEEPTIRVIAPKGRNCPDGQRFIGGGCRKLSSSE
ncbi:unnamed protein product [Allacma fusca]|uniref:Uncharacterized protein n=1 Tax=Allacma fusca TaxID=39272 RepID=A0A8J2K3Z8_9HEXA|nr:unnamed protein product [Allacma fusca]